MNNMNLIVFLLLFTFTSSFIPMNYDILHLKLKLISHVADVLPNIDIVGHNILNSNKVLIQNIVELTDVPIELKKDLILKIIHATQYGDEFGSIVLTNYEKLVNCIL
jgi:hypothetical protein|tara:strand:- start:587 stop:907 length:321 start_codon:yes stop_codon:yes gene_type:complete